MDVIKTQKYFSLAPSSNIEKPAYFSALDEALNDNSIKNIAVTGAYGSGKSSILESYILKDTNNNYMRVSLGNFCEKKHDISSKDEKEIEEHILQQLFYQIDHSQIPYSGFKKICNHKNITLFKQISLLIVWLLTLAFIPRLFRLINENLQSISSIGIKGLWNSIIWSTTSFNILILCAFIVGLFYVFMFIYKVVLKGQIRKITVKSAQVELSQNSVLNKYIDEIIYFFESTENNVVVIEDLDRFNSIALFSKLREVNFLINNTSKRARPVKFIYAIRDDIFSEYLNRMKFFDFILPIVPVVNTTNSGEILIEFLKENPEIRKSYINEISLFVHDLRLLKNIVNEYKVFRGVLNTYSKESGVFVFSLVLYKNLFPLEFNKEHYNEGLLYRIFNEKKMSFLQMVLTNKENRINELNTQKDNILRDKAKSDIELRKEYVLRILIEYPGTQIICNSSIKEIIEDEIKFGKLLIKPQIQRIESSYGPMQVSDIDFISIQKAVQSDNTYQERLILIKQRKDGNLKNIELEIQKEKIERERLSRSKLFHLIRNYNGSDWKIKLLEGLANDDLNLQKSTKEIDLFLFLIRKGYIDENYLYHMSYFYEGSLDLNDFEFLLNVKNVEGDNFDYKLTNVKEIVARIDENEFENQAALNKEIIFYFLKNSNYSESKLLSLLLGQLIFIDDAFVKYIKPLIDFLKTQKKELNRFIELLVDKRYYVMIWSAIEQQHYDDTIKDDLLKDFLFLSAENLQALNEFSKDNDLEKYLTTKADFVEVFNISPEIENVTKLISSLELKFKNITFGRYGNNEIFNFIYENCYYELNQEMLYLMLFNKYELEQSNFDQLFYQQNYTSIISSNYDVLNNFVEMDLENYINNVYLKLDSPQNESENAISSFIENLSNLQDTNILRMVLTKISSYILNIEEFNKEEKWSLLFETNCIKPNWGNLLAYFKYNGNVIDEVIVNWLNTDTVFNDISKISLSSKNFRPEDSEAIVVLMTSIMANDDLTIESYTKLLLAINYLNFPKIDLSILSPLKISTLIEFRKIAFNSFHYNLLLNNGFIDELSTFTLNTFSKFISSYTDFEFSLALNKFLLNSSHINFNEKKSLIKKVSITNLTDVDFARHISKFLITSRTLFIENEKLLKVIRVCEDNNLRIKLFDKYFDKFSFAEIDIVLKSMGGEYMLATEARARRVWSKNQLNLSIAEKLNKIGYFTSIDPDFEKGIKVIVRY